MTCVWVCIATNFCIAACVCVATRVCVAACVCAAACLCVAACVCVCVAASLYVAACVCCSTCLCSSMCVCVAACLCVAVCIYVAACLCVAVDGLTGGVCFIKVNYFLINRTHLISKYPNKHDLIHVSYVAVDWCEFWCLLTTETYFQYKIDLLDTQRDLLDIKVP